MLTVPFLIDVSCRTPDTYHQAGIRRGTVTSIHTLSGTTSRERLCPTSHPIFRPHLLRETHYPILTIESYFARRDECE
jgi:hypothetical protein